MTAALFLAGRDWLVPSAIVAGVAVVLVAISYFRTPGPRGLRFAAALLKLVGVALLLACLLEPMWSDQRAKPGANQFAIVADNSQSMTLRDVGATETRGETMRRVVTGERNLWRTVLAENFDVRNYLADARLQQTHDFHDLTFDGRSSALGAGLHQLAERHRGQPLAGIALLSDGIAPDLAEVAKMPGLPPIYPVVFGHGGPERDLAVGSATVSQTSFEDAPVTIQAELAARGLAGEEVVAKLEQIEPGKDVASEKPVAEQTITLPREEGGKTTLRFQIRPAQTGVIFYRLSAKTKGDVRDEATLVNNETIVAVDRGAGPYRALYVGGRPNWEYKFLRRAVQADDQMQLVALIRVAKREPKFEFRGRSGESSNPLFRGFGNQSKEDVERYDQPVIVRLATDDESELRGGFPKTAEELYKYRAVILDDLEAEFFTADQMSLLQRFVSERGGGLLMLGGMESFRDGKFARTAIGDLLPVYLDHAPDGSPAAGPLRLGLTREGWLQPWARLRMTEADERGRLGEVPAFDVLNRVGAAKPAAQVVATVTNGTAEFPALVTQSFGRGRTAAMLIGDFWQSGLADPARQADLLKSWRQMVRWLVADVPEPIEVRIEPQSEGVMVRVRARDAKFEPLENASVALKITRADAAPDVAAVALTADASASEPGVYETTFLPRLGGGYRVDAVVTNETGAIAGGDAAGWSSDLGADEFRDLQPNRALMEQLARQTGGRVLAPEDLEAFARELPSKRAVVNETWTQPLWHTPWMFALALGCLVGEWGLRRWKGLA